MYAWIRQIANSNKIYPLDIIKSSVNEVIEENIAPMQYTLIKVRTMCPAVIFAASRNDSVIGRTMILVVSIITKKGFNHSGAPSGKKCAIDFFVLRVNDEMIIFIHIGSPIDRVKIRCLEEEREYGIIPVILIKIINVNNVVIIDDVPFRLIDIVCDNCVIIVSIVGKYK